MKIYVVTLKDVVVGDPFLVAGKVYVTADSIEEACGKAKAYLTSLANVEVIKCEYSDTLNN